MLGWNGFQIEGCGLFLEILQASGLGGGVMLKALFCLMFLMNVGNVPIVQQKESGSW